MNCLCCGKILRENEIKTGWHRACIRRFFGTDMLPQIEIDDSVLKELAIQTTSEGFTVTGVQKKLSLHLSEENTQPRLTLVDYPMGYILKPAVKEYNNLPESEHLVMSMAEVVGIKTVPHALLRDSSGYAYITKRVDRLIDRGQTQKFAMEDFCQLDLRLTEDKYRGSYERCAKIIRRYSAQSGLDISELFIRLVFSYLVGNSDMHLKNFSLIESEPRSNQYILSPAYDLLPVNLILPTDKDQMALTLNGKNRNLHRNDFLKYADSIDISRTSAQKMIKQILSKMYKMTKMIDESPVSDDMKVAMKNLMEYRASCLRTVGD